MKEKNNKDSREVRQVLDSVNRYSKTFMLLNKYDSNDLGRIRLNLRVTKEITYSEAKAALHVLKLQLMDPRIQIS